jgi:hypothetical protein
VNKGHEQNIIKAFEKLPGIFAMILHKGFGGWLCLACPNVSFFCVLKILDESHKKSKYLF